MNIEEKKAKLDFMQSFFFVSFLVGYVLLLISSLLSAQMQDFQHRIMQDWFQVGPTRAGEIIVLILGMWKILLIQFTLVPGIAIWLIKKFCKNCKHHDEHKTHV